MEVRKEGRKNRDGFIIRQESEENSENRKEGNQGEKGTGERRKMGTERKKN